MNDLQEAAEKLGTAVREFGKVLVVVIQETIQETVQELKEFLDQIEKVQQEEIDYREERSWEQEQRREYVRSYDQKQRTRYKVHCHRFMSYEKSWKAWKAQRR